ncbi:lysM domain receptor-like kinase 4 [Pyrus ussuriensis x Pyrus communis]|uniref:LysM domain receptor-like kinase 4 n=1 Tax=Pyrus ussuriensis x Pyrus communis TaxID=2448454 RepID=A0A5N5GQV8_9ROSA|nr:lysM domain receptor-like kinase 4 [Pyrus ussuriensis x Pyrus communis]
MVSAISNMLTSDVSQLAEINSLVIVPITCSCSGEYYQLNTFHVVVKVDTFLIIANNTLPGLSTCQAMLNQNSNLTAENLYIGDRLIVALRCACPTKNQTDLRFKYRLTYLIAQGDYPPTSSPSPPAIPPPPSNNSNKTWVYALGGGGLVLVIGDIIFCTFFRGSTKKGFDPIIASESFEPLEKPQEKKVEEEVSGLFRGLSGIAQSLQVYKFEDLQRATGSVYRAKINEDLAAIKKMNGDVSKEINLLQKVSHSTLIRLFGVFFNVGHSYLIYEYAVNGPLSDWIYYSSNHGKFLNWTQKIQILLDVASGLHYLHSFATPPPCPQGFFFDKSHCRNIGYIAPEYLENGLISTKLDVYAFGALRLEVLTGKEVAMFYEKNICLSDVVYSLLNNEDGGQSLKEFMDPSMQKSYPPELALAKELSFYAFGFFFERIKLFM